MAFQRLGLEQVEAGGILEAENKLAIRELVDAGELDLDNAAQKPRQSRAEITGEAVVKRLQGAHLLLADALGMFEIVRDDLIARQRAPTIDAPIASVSRPRAGGLAGQFHLAEQGFIVVFAEGLAGLRCRGSG